MPEQTDKKWQLSKGDVMIFGKLGDNFKDVMGLFKATFLLIGKDKDLLQPFYRILAYRLVSLSLIFSTIYLGVQGSYLSAFGMFMGFLGFSFLSAFLQIRQQAALSWMSYEVVTGKDTDHESGTARLSGHNFQLLIIAIINKTLEKGSQKQATGFKGMLLAILTSVLTEVWDIVHNFLIPTMVIEKKSMKDSVVHLKTLKKNIPGALAGVLGSDLAGGLLGQLITLPLLFCTGISLFGGALLQGTLPVAWTFPTPFEGMFHTINFLPLFTLSFLYGIAYSCIATAVLGTKSIYFSIFYTSLNHPLKIHESFRKDVTNYLNYNGKLKGLKFFDKFTEKKEEKSFEISAKGNFDQKLVDKIKGAFDSNLKKGHTTEVVINFLLKKNIKQDVIDFSYNEYLEDNVAQILPLIKTELSKGQTKESVSLFLKEKGYPKCVLVTAFKKVS